MTAPAVHLIGPGDERWATALGRTSHDVYATRAYLDAEARRLEADAVGCLVENRGGVFLLPLLIRKFCTGTGSVKDAVSPYGYPGVVVEGGDAAFADDCLDACLEALREEDVCSAFVRLHPMLNAPNMFRIDRHPVTEHGLTVSIDLTTPADRAWALLSKGHANAINRAVKAGFEVEIVPARQRVGEFISVYAETLHRLGAADSYHFGDDYLLRLANMEQAYVAVALLDGVVAGAYMLFESHGVVQMHLGGPRTEFRKPSPSHLMIHAVSEWARRRGDSSVHLGGGLGAAEDDSLFTFKAGFSNRRHRFRTLRLVTDRTRYDAVVRERAHEVGSSVEELLRTDFFPAYRAALDPAGRDAVTDRPNGREHETNRNRWGNDADT